MSIGIIGITRDDTPEFTDYHRSELLRQLKNKGHFVSLYAGLGTPVNLDARHELWVVNQSRCSTAQMDLVENHDAGQVVYVRHPADIVDEVNSYFAAKQKKTKLREAIMDSASTDNDRRRLVDAIREVGFYHPGFMYTFDHVKGLKSLGLVKSVDKAMAALDRVQYMQKARWAKEWKALDLELEYQTHECWALAGPVGKQIKTLQTFKTQKVLSREKLKKVMELLKLQAEEPDAKSRVVHKPVNTSRLSELMPKTAVAQAGETLGRKELSQPSNREVNVAAQVAEVPSAPTPTPDVLSPAHESTICAPTFTEPKSELEELIAQLNVKLAKSKVRSFSMTVSETGQPSIEFEQVQIRTVTSLDELI